LKKDTETNFHTVETESGPIMVPYVVRRSNRSRRMNISLDEQNQALLTIPARGTIKAAVVFLEQCGDWLVKQMDKTSRPKSILEYLRDKPLVTLNGVRHKVNFAFTNKCPYCECYEETAEVVLRYDPYSIHEARIREALKKMAREFLTKRLFFLCESKTITPPSRVTVRNQSSRWGSCSPSRGISLNWRLILLPVLMQDYVILHELAHLTEMNHSKRFWGLLNSYDSRSRSHDRRLSEIGRSVISLGQSAC